MSALLDTADTPACAADSTARTPASAPRRWRGFETAAPPTTAELLAVVAGGPAASRRAALETMLAAAGGLRQLGLRTAEELAAASGIGAARAQRLVAALELGRRSAAEPLARGAFLRTSGDVFRHFHPALRDLRVEQFRLVLLDGKHRYLRDELVSQGTLTSSPVHPREVFGPAIRHAAAAVVLVHNHPSGDPSPSSDDLEITRRLVHVGDLIGIRVVDHVIVGDGVYVSLGDRGLLTG